MRQITARWVASGSLIAMLAAIPSMGDSSRTHIVYAVSAHPDDEGSAWHGIEKRQGAYSIFVIMTQGEHTTSCLRPEDAVAESDPEHGNGWFVEGVMQGRATGPYKYQGPGSPVGEPDKGERRPLGDPWQGKGTDACKAARVASWHWFLDDMASVDGSLPSFHVAEDPLLDDEFRGTLCGVGATCAQVWANEHGARVAFDAHDGSLKRQDVLAALALLRARRSDFGIPDLPERGVVAAVYQSTVSDCGATGHRDHEAVHAAIYDTDLDAGPQIGATCDADPRWKASPGPLLVQDPLTKFALDWVDPVTERRVGFYHENYGWLFPTYGFVSTAGWAWYWQRFN